MSKRPEARPHRPEGYDVGKKGYQPSENPPPKNPPQGGSGVVPAPAPKPSKQEGVATKKS